MTLPNERAAPELDPGEDLADLDDRRLCPDGNCLGVLDVYGRCPICGAEGEPARTAVAAGAGRAENEAAPSPAEPPDSAEARSTSSGGSGDEGDDWQARALCSDGDCIGVLDAEGVCKVCGKRAAA